MPIYTGRGDEGKTDLWGSSERVGKDSPRIEATGTVDELIAFLGHAAARCDDDIANDLAVVQDQLHVVMAELADADRKGGKEMTEEQVERLEALIDDYDAGLPELDGFILPGGSDAGALLHVSRAVCRRAERRIVSLAGDEPLDTMIQAYVNRLSDLLFVLARVQNQRDGVEETAVAYGG